MKTRTNKEEARDWIQKQLVHLNWVSPEDMKEIFQDAQEKIQTKAKHGKQIHVKWNRLNKSRKKVQPINRFFSTKRASKRLKDNVEDARVTKSLSNKDHLLRLKHKQLKEEEIRQREKLEQRIKERSVKR